MAISSLILLLWAAPDGPLQVSRKVDDQSKAVLSRSEGVTLHVSVGRAEELEAAVRIYTGILDGKTSRSKLGLTKAKVKTATIEYSRLSPPFKRSVVRALWPKDRSADSGWVHVVTHKGQETLWLLSELLTGSGAHYKEIMKANGKRESGLKLGEHLRIPEQLLLPAFKPRAVQPQWVADPVAIPQAVLETQAIEDSSPLPLPTDPSGAPKQLPPAQPPPGNTTAQAESSAELERLRLLRAELRYGSDAQGSYALYRLQAGEAIYSAVVVRFCGLVSGEEVNREAQNIIVRNGIRDETDLAVGTAIKIPYDLLQPEFRREDDAEYLGYMANLQAVLAIDTEVDAAYLDGLRLILDAGHGGKDPGARFGEVWEDDFVYDIACRIRQRLHRDTRASVHFSTYDPDQAYSPKDVTNFPLDQDEVLLTKPRFSLNHSDVASTGVNLRWALANDLFHQWVQEGIKPSNVLFVSLHADSLHSSITGSMVYIPDARYCPTELQSPDPALLRYVEGKGNSFKQTRKELETAQARSLVLANKFLHQIRSRNQPVHPEKPVRSLVLRQAKAKPFVPAVLRYSRVPTRMLVEVCNLNNPQDRKRLQNPAYRQEIADSFCAALLETYGAPVHISSAKAGLPDAAKVPDSAR
jgi:N-acetylmuramoyl-L-alanine amidase